MRFEYKRYRRDKGGDITRPIVRVLLRNPREPLSTPIAYEALVDSGSDRTIFPAPLAELLGIELTATEHVHKVGGVVAGERRSVYFHPIEMTVGEPFGPSYLTSVGFMPDLSRNGHGLLGRVGFFDQFSFVKFKQRDHIIEIGRSKG